MTPDEYRALSKRLRDLKRDYATRDELPRTFRQLVVAILDHVNTQTLRAFPSQKTLARIIGVSERSVRRNLRAIIKLGLFKIIKDKGHRKNNYALQLDAPAWQKQHTELVAKVASKYAAKGCGLRTRASGTQTSSASGGSGRERPVDSGRDTDASVLLTSSRSVVDRSGACDPHHERSIDERLAAAPLAGSTASQQPPASSRSSLSGVNQQAAMEESDTQSLMEELQAEFGVEY